MKEKYIETEFIEQTYDRSSCRIYFTDEHFPQILEQIQYIKQIAHTLPTFEGREWVGNDEDLFDDIWDFEEDENYIIEDDDKEIKTPLELREDELARLEKEEQRISELEQMINKYSLKDENSIGE